MDEEQYEKVFRILRQLASDESIQYEIKTIKRSGKMVRIP